MSLKEKKIYYLFIYFMKLKLQEFLCKPPRDGFKKIIHMYL